MTTWPKRCTGCGVEHFIVLWSSLPFVGFQDDGDGGRIELRNCDRCNTTLAIEVTPSGLTEMLRYELADVLEADARELAGLPPPYTWPPRLPRDVSATDRAEAQRLFAIADDLRRTSEAA